LGQRPDFDCDKSLFGNVGIIRFIDVVADNKFASNLYKQGPQSKEFNASDPKEFLVIFPQSYIEKNRFKKVDSFGMDFILEDKENLLKLLKLLSDNFCAKLLKFVLDNHANLEKIWDFNWIDWFQPFFKDLSESNYSIKIQSKPHLFIESIFQKLIIFDLQRKNSQIAYKKGFITDSESLLQFSIESLIDYLNQYPVLKEESSSEFISNFVTLYRCCEDNLFFSIQFLLNFGSCVNQMLIKNNPNVRSHLKSSGLLQLKDNSIIQMLSSEIQSDEFLKFLKLFSFEMISNQPKFRDSNGLLFLFRFFHQFKDHLIQETLGLVLITYFTPNEENRKAIKKLIDDDLFCDKFFSLSDQSSLNNFISWYFNGTPEVLLKKKLIEQRLESLYLPISSIVSKSFEKRIYKRNKRSKARKDRLLRQSTLFNKNILEHNNKIKQLKENRVVYYQNLIDDCRIQRHERFKIGEEFIKSLNK
ncbi:hypothetical protein ROZALSC1DRAFT_23570, partial [Rozella allomycis CSF55]